MLVELRIVRLMPDPLNFALGVSNSGPNLDVYYTVRVHILHEAVICPIFLL